MQIWLTWTIYIVGVLVILGAFIVTATAVWSWTQPRLRRIARAEKPPRAVIECCPPGLGCNDPDEKHRKCLRREALRIATVEELGAVNRAWAALNGTPRRNRKARTAATARYTQARDAIIDRALRDAADSINASRRAALPAVVQPQGVEGEVVENGSASLGVKDPFA